MSFQGRTNKEEIFFFLFVLFLNQFMVSVGLFTQGLILSDDIQIKVCKYKEKRKKRGGAHTNTKSRWPWRE